MELNWITKENALHASFKFKDFIEAWAFMNQVALMAEKMNHHPNWSNVYNNVHIQLCTHEARNTVTQKDIDLANEIDIIYKTYANQ